MHTFLYTILSKPLTILHLRHNLFQLWNKVWTCFTPQVRSVIASVRFIEAVISLWRAHMPFGLLLYLMKKFKFWRSCRVHILPTDAWQKAIPNSFCKKECKEICQNRWKCLLVFFDLHIASRVRLSIHIVYRQNFAFLLCY